MRTLFTEHLDGDFRTHEGAKGATVAVLIVFLLHGMITVGVELIGGYNIPLLAGNDAKMTFLANISLDFDGAFQIGLYAPVLYRLEYVAFLLILTIMSR
jgi:hypothetical protein